MTSSAFTQAKNQANSTRQYLLFGQGDSLFAVELGTVREVLSLRDQPISPVPNTQPFLLGLTNLRGEILPVADFGSFLAIDRVDSQHFQSRILVVEASEHRDAKLPLMRIGLAVSRVEGVLPLNPDQIVSAVEVSPDLALVLKGLYNCDQRLLMILDVEAIAHSDRW